MLPTRIYINSPDGKPENTYWPETRCHHGHLAPRYISNDGCTACWDLPYHKYEVQKATTKRRGIKWALTFKQWWTIWEPHWHNRGRNASNYVMARKGDVGPYSVGNVYITTASENNKLASVKAVAAKRAKRLAKVA